MNFQRFAEGIRLGVPAEAAMDLGLQWKGSTTKTKTTSTPTQSAQYNTLLSDSDNWLNSGGLDANYGGSADFDNVADLTGDQTSAISGLASTGANLQSLYDSTGASSLANYLGSYDPSKTGLSSAIDAANSQLDWNYNTQVAPTLTQGAVQTGQYGSSRSGVAQGIAQSQLSQQKTNAASQLAYQDQQAYNTNQLNALNNLSNITTGLNSGNTAQYNAGALTQTQNQQEIDGDLTKWAYENNVDLNNLQAYKALISGDMGGTTTSTSTTPSSALSSLGAIAGTVAGSAFGGIGAGVGAGIGKQIGTSVGGGT